MKRLFLILAFLLLLSGGYAQAQTFCQGGSCTYTSLEPLPGLPSTFGPNSGSFPELVSKSFQLLLGAGAAIAVVMLIIGALTYMFSDVITDKFKAKERIRNTMWAIVLLVSSYLILNTINPDLVTFKLNFSAISGAKNSQTSAPLQIAVTAPNSVNIYDGATAYDDLMRVNEKCTGGKRMSQTGSGTDTRGRYVTWTCQ